MQAINKLKTTVRHARQWTLRFLSHTVGLPLSLHKAIVVIAPHPDDEVLGCGGLIAHTLADGGNVDVIVLTGGERSHDGCCDLQGEVIKEARRGLAADARRHLSLPADRLTFFNWGDERIAEVEAEASPCRVEELAGWLTRIRPEAVFAPHSFEGWSDHEAAERTTRAAIERSGVRCRLFHYCVWFWFSMPLRKALRMNWRRARVLDVSDVYDQKRAAIDAYLKPCAPCGNPWSGVLPPEFLSAFKWKRELFFEVDTVATDSTTASLGTEGCP